MDDAGIGALPHFVGEDRGGILLGVARMDDDRQLRFACRRKMRAETRLLTCAIRMIVIIIEPAFADADDARMLRPRDQPRSEEHTSELQSLMRISYAVFCLK